MDEPFDEDVYAFAYDDDEEVALQFRLNLGVTDDNWGIEFGLGYDISAADPFGDTPSHGGEGDLFVYNAHGWMSFVDLVTVRAGLIDPAAWAVGGWIDDNVDAGFGIRAEIMPMEGLNVGAMFSYPLAAATDDDYNTYGTIGGFFQEIAFGFTYAQEDFFELTAALKLNSNEVIDPLTYESDQEMNIKLLAGFGFYGVENLSLYAGLSMTTDMGYLIDPLTGEFEDELSHDPDDGKPLILIGLNAGYDVTPELWAGLEIGFTLWDGLKMIEFYPEVSYQVSEEISVGAGIPFAMAENEDEDLAFAKVGLDLWAKYTVGNAFAQLGYGFTNYMENFGDKLDHYIQLTFGFSF